MNRSTLAALPLILGLATTVSLETLQQQRDAEAMADAASNFLTSLSRPQRSQATFAFDSDERSRHHKTREAIITAATQKLTDLLDVGRG